MMRFGGIQKFSLCDFPGKTAAVLFTQGCNFRCPFCHNSGLLPQKNLELELDTEAVVSFLEKRSGQLEGVVISGGEPTLQPGLKRFCHALQNLGFRIKLDTNGSRPEILRELFAEELLDSVAMDIKAVPERYHLLAGVAVEPSLITRSIAIIARSGVPALFRTTWVGGLHRQEERLQIPAMLPEGMRHIFQPCRVENTLCPERCSS